MEIKEKYIRRYWNQMVEEQVYDDYVAKGYEVRRDCLLGESKAIRADFFATRGDEKLIIELVTKAKPKDYVLQLYDIAREMGAELNLVYANYVPITMKNGFEGFELAFERYLNNDYNPGEFGEFGSLNFVEEVIDAEFTGIYISGMKAELSGNCTIDLMASFDREDPEREYYVPCKFEVEMEHDKDGWCVVNHKKLEFDTSQLDR